MGLMDRIRELLGRERAQAQKQDLEDADEIARNPDLADQNAKLLGPQVQSGFTVGQGERFLEE
jgi:hypothetical protein